MIKSTKTKIKMEINVGQRISKVIIPTSRTLIIIMIILDQILNTKIIFIMDKV